MRIEDLARLMGKKREEVEKMLKESDIIELDLTED
jgi:hypothetical protein